jgi:1-acyl-sn-glycerol-3-phosphate acyltransferase
MPACWRCCACCHILKGSAWVAGAVSRAVADQQHARVQAWSQQLLARAGHRCASGLGTPPVPMGRCCWWPTTFRGSTFLVMHAARHCRFVSKSDVQAWPLIGTLATAAGTLYIERASRRDAMRMVHHMHEALSAARCWRCFRKAPRATAGHAAVSRQPAAGRGLGRRAGGAGGPALCRRPRGDTSFAPSYIGDETLVGSIWRTLCAPGIEAVVQLRRARNAPGPRPPRLGAALHDTVDACACMGHGPGTLAN